MRRYKVEKSKYYTDEKKHLFISYIFYYFNIKTNKFRICNNVNSKQKLKELVIDVPDCIGKTIEVGEWKLELGELEN